METDNNHDYVSIYENRNSLTVIKHIELMHFTFMFQGLFNSNEIVKCFYENKRIVAIDSCGDDVTDII